MANIEGRYGLHIVTVEVREWHTLGLVDYGEIGRPTNPILKAFIPEEDRLRLLAQLTALTYPHTRKPNDA